MSIYQQPENKIDSSERERKQEEIEKKQNEIRYKIVRTSQDIESLTTKLVKKCVDFMNSQEFESLSPKEKNNMMKYYNSAMHIYTLVSIINLSTKQPYDKYDYDNFSSIISKNSHIIEGLRQMFPTEYNGNIEQEWSYFFKNCCLDVKTLENDKNVKEFESYRTEFFNVPEYNGYPEGKVFNYILLKIIDILYDSYFSLISKF